MTRLWLDVANRLSQCSPPTTEDEGSGNSCLGTALEDALLPHGTQLPQTGTTALPPHPVHVTQPTGIGLERVISLLRRFLPSANSFPAARDDADNQLLWGLLELVLLQRQRCPGESGEALPTLLPAPRVVLGLLAGLEISWASAMAPKCQAGQQTTPGKVLGLFPLSDLLPETTELRARKVQFESFFT